MTNIYLSAPARGLNRVLGHSMGDPFASRLMTVFVYNRLERHLLLRQRGTEGLYG